MAFPKSGKTNPRRGKPQPEERQVSTAAKGHVRFNPKADKQCA
jgi:hypothetical protein